MTSISNICNHLTSILSYQNNFHSLEVVDRVSETQLQVGENSDWIIWRLNTTDHATIFVFHDCYWEWNICSNIEIFQCLIISRRDKSLVINFNDIYLFLLWNNLKIVYNIDIYIYGFRTTRVIASTNGYHVYRHGPNNSTVVNVSREQYHSLEQYNSMICTQEIVLWCKITMCEVVGSAL